MNSGARRSGSTQDSTIFWVYLILFGEDVALDQSEAMATLGYCHYVRQASEKGAEGWSQT